MAVDKEEQSSPTSQHVKRWGKSFSNHMYADDTQVYIELSQSDTHKSISSLSDCLTGISLWMKSSKLKLNSDKKTEFIIIGTKEQRHKLSNHFPVKLLDNKKFNI